jgi:hypothetical protein
LQKVLKNIFNKLSTKKIKQESPYKLSISLNVLYHLGINLYSNIPAVLTELVANCWDADANMVDIKIDPHKQIITIQDDGIGMSLKEVNNRFLKVGYERRKDPELKTRTKKGRHVMGRKGIGKLSVFSMAKVVEIHSVKKGEKSGFIMDLNIIRTLIDKEGDDKIIDYRPTPVSPANIKIKKGTKIILSKPKKRITAATASALKKRLARRFSVIDDAFKVKVNRIPIGVKDRDYFNKLQYIWYFGSNSKHFAEKAKNADKTLKLENSFGADGDYKITGWIGTVKEQKNIDEENNIIVLLAHGKLIQEDILKDLKEEKLYTYYLMGEINADFLDDDQLDDIVTSDRQRIKEDDDRYIELKKYILDFVLKKEIKNNWEKWRRTEGVNEATKSNPYIEKWFNRLTGDNRRAAEDLFGRINTLKISDPEAKKELYKSSILAFENLVRKNNLSALQSINSDSDFQLIKHIFSNIDDVEAVEYYNITKGRLDIIKKFEELVPTAKEKMLQTYLFTHLWLLNPAWERATDETKKMEQTVSTILKTSVERLSPKEKSGRLDIYFKASAGEHVIIELKKYNAQTKASDLIEQVTKYKSALEKILNEKFSNEPKREIRIICVLGSPPRPFSDKSSIQSHQRALSAYNAEFITYDELIRDACDSYAGYMEKESDISELLSIIEKI